MAVEVIATQSFVNSAADSSRSGAVAAAHLDAQAMFDQVTALNIPGAVVYKDNEAITYNPASPVQRIYNGNIYQLAATTPGGLPPLGVGDGSDTDQQLLALRVSGHAAAAGVNGGQGGAKYTVTNASDDPNGTTVGSLRNILLTHQQNWRADPTAAAWITLDKTAFPQNTERTIVLTADLNILCGNITFDCRGSQVTFNGGGKPGPQTYGLLASSHAAGATTLTLKAGWNFNASKLRVGHLIDVIAVDGTRSTVYGTNLKVAAYDATAGTITLDPTTPLQNTAPINAVTIFRGKTQGQVGFAINHGGAVYNDHWAPYAGRTHYQPAGNIIWCNAKFASAWGGDVMDTGNANDWRTSYFTRGVWFDHCFFSNPDPFHDVQVQIGSGAKDITYSWCIFQEHYKSQNAFGGVDGTGGTNPDGTTSTRHPFPPLPDGSGFYSMTNQGPYRAVDPQAAPYNKTSMHGNSQALPVVVETVTYDHCFMLHLGNRGPKTDNFSEMHIFNCYIKEWGETSDPITGLVYDWPPTRPMTGGSAIQSINFSSTLVENCIFEPYSDSTGGALRAIATQLNGTDAGNVRMTGCVFRNGAVYDNTGSTAVNGPNASKVPNFGARYTYTAQPADSLMQSQILAGAGAHTQDLIWKYIGPATPSGSSGSAPDATTTSKGIVQLAGDLGGTAAAPTVPGLASKVSTSAVGAANGVASLDSSGKVPSAQIPTTTAAVVAGQEIAVATYHPTGAQTAATTTSTTATDIAAAGVTAGWSGFTATSLDCTFTVPSTRIVDVELTIYVKGSASGTAVRWALADGTGTTVVGIPATVIITNGTTENRVQYRRRVDLSALTTPSAPAAGASFTLRPQWNVNSGTGTIDVGGVNGGITMRVYAAI